VFENSELSTASGLFEPREGDQALWFWLNHPKIVSGRGDGKSEGTPTDKNARAATRTGQTQKSALFASLRRTAAATILALAFPVAVAAAAFTFSDTVEHTTQGFVSAVLDGPQVAAQVYEAIACASRAPVADATGQRVSWIPLELGCPPPRESWDDGQVQFPHLMTSTVQDDRSLELLAPAISTLEGDHNGPGTLFALSARGLGRVLLREIQRIWSPDLARFGGSTAVLSGFETLRDMHGRRLSEAQKVENMRDMVAFVATSLPQGIERDRFAATTNPVLLIHGGPAGGMSVSGEMAMEALFGRLHINEEWEACVFAAAFYTQIVIPAPSENAETAGALHNLFLSSLASVRRRANDNCLTRMEDEGQLEGDAAEAARQALAEFMPHVSVWNQGTSTNLPGAFAALRDERLLLGPDAGSTETYLEPYAQRMLSRAVDEVKNHTASEINEEHCYTNCDDGQHSVDFLAVAVEFNDEFENVVAIHQTRSGLFHGPVVRAEDEHVRGDVTRSTGSLPKLYLGLRLAAAGFTHLCPRDALGLSDADGAPAADCGDRTQWLTLEESIARSSNRALAEGIRLLGVTTIMEGMDTLGAQVANEPDRRSIVTGVDVPISPERFIRLLIALGRGIGGHPASSYLPQISSGDRQEYLELPAELFTTHPMLLRDVLAASVMHPRGTLRELRQPLAQRGCDMTSIIAKTGTSETADVAGTGIRDRYIALQVTCPDANGVMRNIAVFNMIGSPQVDVPLTGVRAGDLRALALKTLDAGLVAAAARTQNPN
jgi:hypothetical protein